MKNKIIFLSVGLCITIGCYYVFQYKNTELPKLVLVETAAVNVDVAKAPKMRKFRQNKLWRDTAAERLEREDGAIIHRIILDDQEYNKQLGLKLIEEAQEVATAKDKEEIISEIGDVLDVLDCIIKLHNCSQDEIDAARAKKIKERGGSYFNREFVTVSECLPGSFLEQYLLKQPDKYIEILD
jgi:predicted house-cleaning noncanonical NTP pyrophosphatase (MazG superfamily)